MAIEKKTLSVLQSLRLIDRDEIGQPSLSWTVSHFFPRQGGALNKMAAGMEVTGLKGELK